MGDELSVYAEKRKRRKRWRVALICVVIAALFGTAFYFLSTRYFVVREVSIQQTDLYPADALKSTAAIEDGTPLILLSKKDVAKAIEENYPYLVDVEIDFQLPQTVHIAYREEFGEYAVRLGRELFSVDANMNVLAKEEGDSGIRRIEIVSDDIASCIVGQTLTFFDDRTQEALLAIGKALEEGNMLSDVSKIDLADKFNISLVYLDRFVVEIGEESDLKYKLAMVRETINHLDATASGTIDISDPNTAYVNLNDGF